ncbi:MAG: geranylgeranyl reductase family protein [Candidatus Eisenbacteria bacterium]|nr:geranylgeranyl reductase family protein [Candidatus Eisenbacteria bacterium]
MPTSRLPENPDALVVGAGTAGTTVARRIAQAGLEVVLCERAAERDVGRKVCGNALSDDGLAALDELPERPRGPEIAGILDGGTLWLPGRREHVRIPVGGIVLNRVVFGQRLLHDAARAGAVIVTRCTCAGWADRTRGSIAVRSHDGQLTELKPRIVVDASGYASVLTRGGGPTHPYAVSRADVGIGYRRVVPLLEPLEEPTEGRVVLGPEGAGEGYGWVFPVSDRLANVGLGGPLASVGSGIRRAFDRFVASERDLVPGGAIDQGAGMLPLRRPIPSLVGDGFLSVGDAAGQTSPLHGGGIAPSILAGAAAAETAVRALRSGDTSAASLWDYNVWYMRDAGARHAAHDMLRRILYSLSDDDLAYLTVAFARAGLMMGAVRHGGLRPPIREALGVAGRALRRPGLTASLIRAGRLVDRVSRLHRDYPTTPERLDSWIGHAEYLNRALTKMLPGGAR